MLNYLILFIQQFFAGSTPVVAKSLAMTIDPTLALLLRGAVSAAVYAVIVAVLWKKAPKITPREWAIFVLLGVLCIPMNQLLYFIACKYTAPPNVALAYALVPAFVLVMEIIFLKVKATRLKLVGVGVAVIGTVVIYAENGIDLGSEMFVGNILGLIAAMSWAVYTIVGKKIIQKYGAFFSTGMAIILGFIVYVPIFALIGDTATYSAVDAVVWGKIAYMAIVLSVISYGVWYVMLRRMDASKVSVFNNLQPIITPVLTAIFLTFTPTPQFVVGAVTVITGVIMTQRG